MDYEIQVNLCNNMKINESLAIAGSLEAGHDTMAAHGMMQEHT